MNRIGLLTECAELNAELPHCTKCGKAESDIAQLHRHLLDCGGDTEWLKTMIHTTKSPNNKKSRYFISFYLLILFNFFTNLIMCCNVKEKIGDPSIFEDVKTEELDMVLNELHLHHLYQLLKLNQAMVDT